MPEPPARKVYVSLSVREIVQTYLPSILFFMENVSGGAVHPLPLSISAALFPAIVLAGPAALSLSNAVAQAPPEEAERGLCRRKHRR
jgi:hypothetical protein